MNAVFRFSAFLLAATLLFVAQAQEDSGDVDKNVCVPGPDGNWVCGTENNPPDASPLRDYSTNPPAQRQDEESADTTAQPRRRDQPRSLDQTRYENFVAPLTPADNNQNNSSSLIGRGNFSLKIAEVGAQTNIGDLADQFALDPNMVYIGYKDENDSERRVVLLGRFSTPAQSRQALNGLPRSVRSMRPTLERVDEYDRVVRLNRLLAGDDTPIDVEDAANVTASVTDAVPTVNSTVTPSPRSTPATASTTRVDSARDEPAASRNEPAVAAATTDTAPERTTEQPTVVTRTEQPAVTVDNTPTADVATTTQTSRNEPVERDATMGRTADTRPVTEPSVTTQSRRETATTREVAATTPTSGDNENSAVPASSRESSPATRNRPVARSGSGNDSTNRRQPPAAQTTVEPRAVATSDSAPRPRPTSSAVSTRTESSTPTDTRQQQRPRPTPSRRPAAAAQTPTSSPATASRTRSPVQTTTTARSDSPPALRSIARSDRDFLRLSDRNYMLQLGSYANSDAAIDMVSRHSLSRSLTYIIEVDEGAGERWLVLYGDYNSLSAANDTLSSLPSGIRSPWVRRISPLQKALGE